MLIIHLTCDVDALTSCQIAHISWYLFVVLDFAILLLSGVNASVASRKGNPSGTLMTARGEDVLPISGAAGLPVRQVSRPGQCNGKIKHSPWDIQAVR